MTESASEPTIAAALDARADRERRARQTLADVRLLMQMEYELLMYPWDAAPWDLLLYDLYRQRAGHGPRPPYAFTFEACWQAIRMLGFAHNPVEVDDEAAVG
jgi:hypothetical protein